jgi:hypothetical protein
MEYVKKYDANLNFFHNLVMGSPQEAWFSKPDTPVERVRDGLDMMHVCHPDCAISFVSRWRPTLLAGLTLINPPCATKPMITYGRLAMSNAPNA